MCLFSNNSAEFGPLSWSESFVFEPGYGQTIFFAEIHLYDPVIGLVGDEDMRVREAMCICTGVFKRFGPEPVCPNWPYCQTIPAKMDPPVRPRLLTTPSGACGITPAGVPVPAIKVNSSDALRVIAHR